MPTPDTERVAFVLKGYPRLSETFIAQEILALERRGLGIDIVSLRHPTDTTTHPVHAEISAPVTYLPEYLHQEPARVFRAWRKARRLPGYHKAWRQWRADFRRDRTRNRIRRFGQACVLATETAPQVRHLHAHFLHTPSSVARYAAMITGLGWTGSAHAKDIYTSPDWELAEKLTDCGWVVTCTATNRDHLSALSPRENVALVYHGLDLARWPAGPQRPDRRDGSKSADPVRLVSVGRAVPKKGYDDLVAALARLPADLHWTLDHIGGGPERERLKQAAKDAGIEQRITWHGAQPQTVVLEAYRGSDLFVLASKIAEDGDRDGLPNVMMEAQSQGLPVVATRVSAVPELIEEDVNGLLAEPGDPASLADALHALITDPEWRQRLGTAGEAHVRSTFSMETCIEDLATRFGL
ncbi:MAG: colanic acid biosynthesis glycosyltransferase WcaL [Rhodospirillaceae bacterium]|nr:colanic acid biosynthesis glycosyltransferase WcaL [Rhodospirillaceae bacterium]